jgi:formate hydrogenlyase transcriptional activator
MGLSMASEQTLVNAEDQLEVLRRIATQMTISRDVSEVLRAITNALVTTARVALARIWLYEKAASCTSCASESDGAASAQEDPALHLAASAGLYTHVNGEHHRIPVGDLKIGQVAQTRRLLSVGDVESDPRITDKGWVRREGIRSFGGCPLLFRDELVGVLGVFSRERLSPEALRSLETFAPQAATAIKTAQLFSEVDRLKDRLARENAYLQEEVSDECGFGLIVGSSPAIRQVLEDVQRVGPTDSTVLLMGETGTGKELIANAIHSLSARRGHPMIRVNCGAIPLDLVDSELFGHERGAFTSAHVRRIGRFELADKSSLFLDEVGELPAQSQPALLRVLEAAEFDRVGGTQPIRVDVRVIAATNRDLAPAGAPASFRQDLFYRLNVFPIRVPPLRERPEDIPELVDHLLARLKRKLNRNVRAISAGSMDRLKRHSWPGNIRELRNVLERACVLARGPTVEIDRLCDETQVSEVAAPHRDVMTLKDAERVAIRRALEVTHGRVSGPRGAAALLAVNPSTLRSRMAQLGIRKPSA